MISNLLPRKYYVTTGVGFSNISKLNAFDNALRQAGISHLNLVAVSSILPRNVTECKEINLEPGTITFTVLSVEYGITGDEITAGIALGFSDNYGYILEAHGKKSVNQIISELNQMFKDLERETGFKFRNIIHKVATSKVTDKKFGCALAAVLLLF